MIANLYLHTESFKYNGTDSSDEVATKIKRLIEDMRDVIYNSSNENVFKVPTQIYNCPIFKEQTIVDFANAYLDGEQQVCFGDGELFTDAKRFCFGTCADERDKHIWRRCGIDKTGNRLCSASEVS